MAVAERIVGREPTAKVRFLCSTRDIDSQILGKTGFEFTALAAQGLSFKPDKFVGFCRSFLESYRVAKEAIAQGGNVVVVGVGGFVAAPVCYAAHKLKVPLVLLNVDIVPGRANRLIGRWADEIFLQFEETKECFARSKASVSVVGCPLRSGFERPGPEQVIKELGLEKGKRVLLITGASSGAENINKAICLLLDRLDGFAGDWQIVHLTGAGNYSEVKQAYAGAKIGHKVLSYFDDMAGLLAAADLVVGRSGAVSVAEYAAAGVPSICMPYPYHRDRHQYLNAGKLVEAGAGVIVDDLPNEKERAQWLAEELERLMKDDEKREEMREGCKAVAKLDASHRIAEKLLRICSGDHPVREG
jgi:UDP-N-acetylglucosamine--N-acetylmuramyl-(pentapeptide) pyrophosphoryl-undecaprenol N-acetylglucosamine transferase